METRKIKHIQFGILSPEEIRAMAVCKIEHAETDVNGIPRAGGLKDPRMGSSGHLKCATCGGVEDCPGHFGCIELVKPLFHYGMMGYVYKVLQSICFRCSRLLSDPVCNLYGHRMLCVNH